MSRALLLALALSLAACADPARYAPATAPGGTGYSERPLGPDRFRVRFAADAGAGREAVETALIHRAAELTLAEGGGHFRILGADTEGRPDHKTELELGFDPMSYRPMAILGLGLATGHGVPLTRYESVAEIVIGPGPPPPDDPFAYDAAETLAALAPFMRRPR